MKRMNIKKMLTLACAAVIAAAFLSCSSDGGGSGDGSEQGGSGSSSATLTVKNASSYTLHNVKWSGKEVSTTAGIAPGNSKKESVSEGFGYIYFSFYPKGSDEMMSCYTAEVLDISKGDDASFTFTNNTIVVQLNDVGNKATLGEFAPRKTTLSIKNSSSYDLKDALWQSYTFSSNPMESVLEKDTEISNTVEIGYGYVYFTRKDTGVSVRTKNVISVNDLESARFEITDATDVVEVNNESNAGLLSNIEKKVVFFDGAEGVYYPYTQRDSAVYSDYTAHSGKHSIRLNKGSLELSIILEKEARLSLWYFSNQYAKSTALTINGEKVKDWTNEHQWEFYTINLDKGNNVIHFYNENYLYNAQSYLDDILIVYTD